MAKRKPETAENYDEPVVEPTAKASAPPPSATDKNVLRKEDIVAGDWVATCNIIVIGKDGENSNVKAGETLAAAPVDTVWTMARLGQAATKADWTTTATK